MHELFEDQAISIWFLIYSYKSGPTITYTATSYPKIINYIVGTISTLNSDNFNDEITSDVIRQLEAEIPSNQFLKISSPEVTMNVFRAQLTSENPITKLLTEFFCLLSNKTHVIDRDRIMNEIIGLFNNRDS